MNFLYHCNAFLHSDKLHVFEIMRCLPRFSMYLLVTNRNLPEPEGCVQFQLAERVNRVGLALFLMEHFYLYFIYKKLFLLYVYIYY